MQLLKRFGPNQIIKFGYLAIDYGTTSSTVDNIAEIYVAFFGDTPNGPYLPPRDALLDEALWVGSMITNHSTSVGFQVTSFHEESFVSETKGSTPQLGGSLSIFAMSTQIFINLYAAGRIEFSVEVLQREFSDFYTRRGQRFSHGEQGLTWEEAHSWEME